MAKKKDEPAVVESFRVDGYTDRAVLEVNGSEFVLDTEQLLALSKQIDAAKVGANY